MRTRIGAVLVAAVVCLSVVAGGMGGVAAANHRDDPRFETDVAEPVLQPGTTQQLTVELTNEAADYNDEVKRAVDVTATVESTDGIEVLSGSRDLGTMGDGATRSVGVQVDVEAGIAGGTHEVPIRVEYRDPDDTDEVVTKRVTATVRVQERARFAVRSVETAAAVGGSGTVAVTVENVGEETATDAVVQFQSTNPDLTFGASSTARRFAGEIAPGETRTVEVDASLAATAEQRSYAVDMLVEYETPGDTPRTSRQLSFGVLPLPEQTFDVSDVESTLRVGEEGELRGTVTNTGSQPVSNAVVTVQTTNPNVALLEPEVAVGSLAPGKTASFAFDVEVSSAAEAGPRQLSLRVEYRDTEGTQRRSDSIDAPVSVAESRNEFAVQPVDGAFAVGSNGQLTLTVTNNREEPVSDVSAKLYLDAPLSSGEDEGFIETIPPGETVRVTFDLSVAGSAIVDKTYPAEVDFQYETSEGDTRISDTYQVPVRATEQSGGGLPLGLGPLGLAGIGLLAVVGLGGGLYARRAR